MNRLEVDADRLWRDIDAMAQIGATAGGGSRRLALTDLDRDGRELFTFWCRAAGLAVTIDGIGNIFARRSGRDDLLPPVMVGSHLDTVPTGGRFDGVLGVLAGLEIFRTLDDRGVVTEAPLELTVWTNEEGCRFPPGMLGSAVFAGSADLEFGLSRVDEAGVTVGEELGRLGYLGQARPGKPIAAFLELHVEQGPELEDNGNTVGVVTGSSAVRLYAATVTGRACHIGPMPMERRRNALVGAARVIVEVDRIGRGYGGSRSSCNFLEVTPNVNNVIPASVRFNIDFRNENQETAAAMEADLHATIARIAADVDMTIDLERYWKHGPVAFDDRLIRVARQSASDRGYPHQDILTIGGHDAINLALAAPAVMVVVPNRDGLSHNEAEFASKEHCAAGANVLMDAVLSVAGRPQAILASSLEATRP